MFTDRTCADLQATPAVNRPDGQSSPTQGAPPPPPPILCARDNQQLRQSVIDAFADHDANRLAGLMLWGGYGHRAAVSDIQSLRQAMRQPLLDLNDPDDPAQTPPPADSSASTALDAMPMNRYSPSTYGAPSVPQLIVHTAGTDGSGNSQELRFDIIQRDGCLWLGHADH